MRDLGWIFVRMRSNKKMLPFGTCSGRKGCAASWSSLKKSPSRATDWVYSLRLASVDLQASRKSTWTYFP